MADEAAGDATTAAPRRSSRRELTPRAPSPAPTAASPSNDTSAAAAAGMRVHSGGGEAFASSSAAPTTPEQQSTRRSRRQVKSTYATHALASLSPTAPSSAPSAHAATSDFTDKKSGKATAEPSAAAVTTEENERITKRRRPNPNAGVSPVPAAIKAPATEVQQVILLKVDLNSPHKAPQAEPVATAVEPVIPSAVPALSPASPTRSSAASPAPNSANRRRRPVSRQQTLLTNGQTGSNAASDNRNPASSIWSLTSALDTATPMGDVDVSMRTQQRKVLGKYTGRECTLLCEVILQQLKRNSMDPKALERDQSPAFIRWEKVAQKLLKTHRLAISPLDAQTLWKFLAYAEQPPTAAAVVTSTDKQEQLTCAGASLDGELLPASDTEDYALSVDKINEKYKRKKTSDGAAAAAATQVAAITTERSHAVETPAGATAATVADAEAKVGVDESVLTEKQAAQIEQPTSDPAASSVVAAAPALARKQPGPGAPVPGSHFRLYPVYGLPTGIPESWQQNKSFNVKETLPLTFVAEKFLKKKPGTVQPPRATATTVSAASPELGVVSATAVQAPAAATVAPAVESTAQEKPPKKKRVRKTESAKSKAGGGTADLNSTTTTGAPGDPPAKKKRVPSQKSAGKAAVTPAPPRTPFVPSSTPPPQPLPPRAAFQFFCRMHEAESLAESFVAAAAATVPGAAAATPEASNAQPLKKKTYFELQELFASASLQVRNACQKLALEDLDRYNRECVRRRIWEKAMSNSPVASPATGAATTASTATTPSTAQPPQQEEQQQTVSIPSLVVPVTITEVPAVSTSSNPAATHAPAK